MAEVGVRAFLEDNVSRALKGVGKGAEKTLNSVRGAADKAKSSFSLLGSAATALNQGLELAKKGWEFFRLAIVDTVAAALEFRNKNDPVLRQLDAMKKSVEQLRVNLGQALIPVVAAVGKAFQPVIDNMNNWLKANRKLIASKLISFLGKSAILLTKGIAGGVLLVSKAWTGWQLIIEGTGAAVTGFFGLLLDGVGAALGALKSLAEATGADGLAAELGGAQEAVSELGGVFSEMSSESVDEMFKIQTAQEELEAKTRATSKAIQEVLGESIIQGQAIVRESMEGTTRSIEEQEAAASRAAEAAAERLADREEEEEAATAAFLERQRKELEAQEERIAREKEIQAERLETTLRITEGAKEAFIGLGETVARTMADQEKTTKEKMREIGLAILNTALDIISVLAAEAAAAVLARSIESFGMPAGPIVGAAAAAAIGVTFAALRVAAQSAASFADGGFVFGGTPGVDSVPIIAQQGEFVMSKSDVSGFRKFASRVLGSSSGQQLADAADGVDQAKTKAGNVNQSTTIINRMWVPSQPEEMRMTRRQAVSQANLRRLGMIPEAG